MWSNPVLGMALDFGDAAARIPPKQRRRSGALAEADAASVEFDRIRLVQVAHPYAEALPECHGEFDENAGTRTLKPP
jgi:hypothetical protein